MSSSRGCGCALTCAREVEQLVGRVAHRREHADDAVAGLARGHEPPRDLLDLLGVGDRGAAELHHDGARRASSARWTFGTAS